jgi:hypothetical protein
MRMTDRMWAGWFTLLVMFALVATSAAEDWPQWMGTRRDSVWRETGIVERFPAGGPPLVWRRDIGY